MIASATMPPCTTVVPSGQGVRRGACDTACRAAWARVPALPQHEKQDVSRPAHAVCRSTAAPHHHAPLSAHARGQAARIVPNKLSLSMGRHEHLRHLCREAPACSLALKRLGDPSARRWCCFGRAHVLLAPGHFGGSGGGASEDPHCIISRLRHV
jgi:hypothetical protein